MSVLQNRLLCITHKLVNIHYKLTAIIPQIKNIACIYAKIAKPGVMYMYTAGAQVGI